MPGKIHSAEGADRSVFRRIQQQCEMKNGCCPRHKGHVVRMLPDAFECSECGDTGRTPCLCATCPDRRRPGR